MKQLLALAFFISFLSANTAQRNLEYESLISDDKGKILRNQIVDLRFAIIPETGPSKMYREIHRGVTTDVDGMINVNIGEGTPQLTSITNLDLASGVHLLKAEVDIEQNGTFVILGTSCIAGSKVTDKGNSTNSGGYRSSNGAESIAMGYNPTASGIRSTSMGSGTYARGNSSTAMGNTTYADGLASTAMGETTHASGNVSTAMGRSTIASGNASTAIGNFSVASGSFSSALGYATEAASHGETVIGTFNEKYTPIDSVGFNENDRVFVIGNGTAISRSNALVVEKNGTITAPSFDLSEITESRALVTKEYVDANAPSGLEAIDEGNGIGYRIVGRNTDDIIGQYAVDLTSSDGFSDGATGFVSFASGFNTNATGIYSTAMGDSTTASGNRSMAIGGHTLASGRYSTAMGIRSSALGYVSTASGSGTSASGSFSVAMGIATIAPSFGETVIGVFNEEYFPNSTASFNQNDRLFVIGNGAGSGSPRSNALTVLKNGNTGFVTTTPLAKIHISEGNDTGLGNNHGYILLGEANGSNISIDNNEIMARNNGNAADLNLQIDGGNLKIGGTVFIGNETIRDAGNDALRINAALIPDVDNTNVLGNPSQRWTTVYATNGTINTSDRREKKNIQELTYGLAEVLEMQPVSFNWKDKSSSDLKLGLIAQDLQALIPEVVNSHTVEIDETSGELMKKELDRLGVYYSDLVPVLIKAIQEQQEIIDAQNTKIDNIERKLDALLESDIKEESNN